MKRIKLLILFFVFLFIPFFINAETCNQNSVKVESIDLVNKTKGVEEKSEASINNNKILLNLSMDEVSDVVEYKLVIKNTSKEDFILDNNSFNSKTDYIKYTIKTEDNSNVIKGNSEKEVLLKLEYEKEVPNEILSNNMYNDNKNLTINFTNDKDSIVNPYTGNINRVIILISILSCGLLLYLYVSKKQTKLFVLLLLLLPLLPLTIKAACVTSVNLESNVQINKKDAKPSILMKGSSGDSESNYLRTNIKRKDIETITFTNSLSNHTVNGRDCFDVSRDEDGSVLAWVNDSDNDGLYEMTIGANGKVYASSGENLFIKLINVTSINGMEYFDTSKATSMYNMFNTCPSMETIDISYFDTSKVTNMSGMFGNEQDGISSSLKQIIGLETINTSNVIDMSWMFGLSTNLITLDVSNFDTSKVTNMHGMFEGCNNLKTIYANDNFDTTNVTESGDMFYGCRTLVGGEGTIYDESHVNHEYARVDKEDSPGYFTNKNSKTATIYYNSNNTLGELSVSIKKVSCVPKEGTSSCTITIPSVVTSSVGQYNSEYKGISDEFNNLNNESLTINSNKVFYAYYSSEVTNYYYNNSYKNRVIYRNEYFTSANEMNSVLSLDKNGIENYVSATGPGSSEWIGLSTEKDTVVEYNNISDAARSDANILYSVYKLNISFEKGANVSDIGFTTSSCNITTDAYSCNVTLPTITYEDGYLTGGWYISNTSKLGYEENVQYSNSTNNNILYANAFDANYKNIDSNLLHESLKTAFSNIKKDDTIIVLKDTVEKEQSILRTSGIKFDLNGKTLTLKNSIINFNGGLDIYNSNSNDAIINANSSPIIYNDGTMSVNGTSSENKIKIQVNVSNGVVFQNDASYTLKIYDNLEVTGPSSAINNAGEVFIYGGVYRSARCLVNHKDATATIDGSNVEMYGVGNLTRAVANAGMLNIIKGKIVSEESIGISDS